MKKFAACGSAIVLAGCATVGGDPLIDAISLPVVPAACVSGAGGEPGESTDTDLCAVLASIRSDAASYRAAAERMDHANVGYGLLQTGSAISLLGFNMFGAHPDNSSDAILVGAIATGARQNIRPERQRDILTDGARGMRCVAQRGAAFLGAARTAVLLRERANREAYVAMRARTIAGDAPASPAFRAQADAVITAAGELDAAVNEAREVAGYREGAVLQTQEGHDRVENSVLSQLRAERPDYTALIAAIRAAATTAPQTAAPTESQESADERYRTNRSAPITPAMLAAIAGDLRSRAVALRGFAAGPGKQQYDAILSCVGNS